MKTTLNILMVAFLFALSACAPPASAPEGEHSVAASETAVVTDPTVTPTLSPEELLSLGQDAANEGRWADAVFLLDQYMAVNSTNPQAYLARGNAYKELGDLAQAISNYDQALAIDPNIAIVYNNRGLAHSEAGNAEQALADFAKAIELAPTFGLAFRNRAGIQLAAGNLAAASLDLQIYLTLVPNAPDRAEVEAQIADLQGQVVEAAPDDGSLFSDDFSDPNSGWYSNGDPASPTYYDNGGYRVVMTQANGAVWAMPGRLFTDIRIEVMASKQGGDNDNFFGVMCRVQGTTDSGNFYVLMISSDGYFGIGRRVNGGALELVDQEKMLYSSKIDQGDSTNKITAVCEGERLALYVNDELLVEVTDSALPNGQIGLMAGTFDVPGTNILFDDLKVFAE
jgi:tetratricopeptide (TPR) repeat protein